MFDSAIDCNDCRNYWLIKQEKQNQIIVGHCKSGNSENLFSEDIKTKLSRNVNEFFAKFMIKMKFLTFK